MNDPDIFSAVTSDDLTDLRELLASDASVANSRNAAGMPPLYIAALYRNTEAIELLIDHQADVDIFACCYLVRNERGQRLLKSNRDLVRATTSDGRTPLHYAAQKGNADFVQTLIQFGADVNAVDADGGTPLMDAAHGGPWKPAADNVSIDLLLKNGAKVDLHLAAAIGRTELLEEALGGEDVDGTDRFDRNGYTALYHAAHNNHLGCVRILLSRGANAACVCEDGQTALSSAALHLLSQQCDPDICRVLIENGADYDIHTAAALGDLDRMAELLSVDASLLNASLYGFSPSDYAVHCGQSEALAALLKAGADPNTADEYGNTLMSKCSHLPELQKVLIEAGGRL